MVDQVEPNVIVPSPRKYEEFRDMIYHGLSNDHHWNSSFVKVEDVIFLFSKNIPS